MPTAAPLLLPLPTGLCVSGITTLTLAIARSQAAAGRAVTLIVHPEPPGSRALNPALDPAVRLVDLRHLPPLESAGGDLSPWLPHYDRALDDLLRAGRGPVVAFPNSLGDCFGVLAALTQRRPDDLRIVGWQHNDIPYDAHVLTHYEPVLTRLIAVSDHLRAKLAARLPHRAADCVAITAGVACPEKPLAFKRPGPPARAVRLLYTGRLDPNQKRTGALPLLSAELSARDIDHTLTIVGDGPGRAALARATANLPNVRLLPPAPPEQMPALLEEADCFILPSRFEGLSVAMLEAMARACIPIVTRVESGLSQVITHGVNGLVASAGPEDDEQSAARAIADSLSEALPRLELLALAAHATIRERFTLDRFAADVSRLIDLAAAGPARAWPPDRPAAFTSRPGDPAGSGTVPPEAAARLRAALDASGDRGVLIHGTGRHTVELAPILAEYKDRIIAFADDDPAAMGRELLDRRIIAPARAAAEFARAHGAAEVIISSYIHQEAIYARRAVYEAVGLRVRRLYPAPIDSL